jgi:hypothetical protein
MGRLKVRLLDMAQATALDPTKKLVLWHAMLMQTARLIRETPDHVMAWIIKPEKLEQLADWLVYDTTPRALRALADALELVEQDLDGRRTAIFCAYNNAAISAAAASGDPWIQPTLLQVEKQLENDYRKQGKHIGGLPARYSLRNTLKLLNLPLAPGKSGRPRNTHQK